MSRQMRHSGSGGGRDLMHKLRDSMNARGSLSDLGDRIKVCVRMRPPHAHEHADGVVSVLGDGRLVLHRPDAPVVATEFRFDKVLLPSATQHEVYMSGVKDVVDDVLNGYNGTVMAYGQTGAGKSYTISNVDPKAIGMNTRCVAEIFYQASLDPSHTYTVSMSYIQVYMEMIQDLLHPESDNLGLREDPVKGVFVPGVKEVHVTSLEECLQYLAAGSQNRFQNFTHLNAHSSASHAVVMLTVVKRRRSTIGKPGPQATIGKLYLVDLAGSERLKKSKSTGLQAQQAASINLSLTNMGMCINARVMDDKHVPYRDSKLTRLLQESLGGNSRTILLVNIAGVEEHAQETLQSLQFASRAMNVRVKPQVNECVDVKATQEPPGLSAAQHQEMLAALARKEVEMSASMQDALAKERQRTEELIVEALKSFAPAQKSDPDLEARIAALEERVKVMEDKYNQASKQNAQLTDMLKADARNRCRLAEGDRAKSEKETADQQSTLKALDDLQQSLRQIEAQNMDSSTAQRAPGLDTAAAMLYALSVPPKEAASGLSTAARVVTQLSESPEAAGQKPGTAAAVAALAAQGCAPTDPAIQRGLAAAASALRAMSRSAQANTQPQGVAAAALSLDHKGIDARDAAHAPGMAAAAHALHVLAADARTPPSQVAGITQGASTLMALSADNGDALQQPGLAAANIALARLEAGCDSVSPQGAAELSGIKAARTAMEALEGKGSRGTPQSGGAAAAASLAESGILTWDAKHKPGFDAAAAKIRCLKDACDKGFQPENGCCAEPASRSASGPVAKSTPISVAALHSQAMRQDSKANGNSPPNEVLQSKLQALVSSANSLGESAAMDRGVQQRMQAVKAQEAESLKHSLEDVWQRLKDLDEQVQDLREQQEQAEQEKAKQVEEERIAAAGRVMVALGIDLGDSKYNPGVHLAVAALTTLCSTPPAAYLESGIELAAYTLQKMAQDPQGAAQDRGIDAAFAALEAKGIDPTSPVYRPGMLAASKALSAICASPIGGSVASAIEALTAAGIDPWNKKHKPGVEAAVGATAALAEDPCHAGKQQGVQLAGAVLEAICCNPADEVHQPGMSVSVAIVTSLTLLGSPGHAADQPGASAAQIALAAMCSDKAQENQTASLKAPISSASAALANQGIDPSDPVHQRGMLAAASTLRALCTTSEHGGTTSTGNAHKPYLMDPQSIQSAGIRDMLNQRMLTGGLIPLKLPKPDFGPMRKTEDNEEDEGLSAQSAQLASLEAQLEDAQAGLACTMAALGISPAELKRDPAAAAAAAKSNMTGEMCEKLDAHSASMGAQMADLEHQAQEMRKGLDVALMALGMNREDIERDPEAAAAASSTAYNSHMFERPSNAQLANLEKQLQETQAGLAVALLALGIDQEEMMRDPEAAAANAVTVSNGSTCLELSRKVKEIQAQQKAAQAQARLLEEKCQNPVHPSEIQDALAEVGQRLDALEADREALSDTTVHASDLKELENHILERLGTQARACEQLGNTVEVIVADANKLATLHDVSPNSPERHNPSSKMVTGTHSQPYQPFTITSVMQRYLPYDAMLKQFAQKARVRDFVQKVRSNHETVLKALKEMDVKNQQKHEAIVKVLIRISQQVDYLHNTIRDVARGDYEEAAHMDTMPAMKIPHGHGRPTLNSMGTLQRHSNLRNLVAMQGAEDEDSAVDIVLRKHEAEQDRFEAERDSGGSRKSAGWDRPHSLARSRGASLEMDAIRASLDHPRSRPSQSGRASQEMEADGLKGVSMARENGGASRASGGWDLVLESANRRKEYEDEEGLPAEPLRPRQM
ncbi:hypothetical protein DUNSADRAFT_11339 [Dunaliella salina]|uniref:Kinesin motor domain-containing protein n=1 Tax=Dunaliella salina TaxID=3046 RepID=A0ABQ7GDK8_DUNSA|nr:hypothetical protein DUNSADRAFT_11339 [Dunaliella salina]|eukprot:KAF5832695.1 hypothetical protein DUNSADRAFT_11339 [Dunaliella salina]